MIKKIIFLILPLIVVYWRSNLAQNAVRWLFRGVLPTDGPLGQFMQNSGRPANPGMNTRPHQQQQQKKPQQQEQQPTRRKSLAASAADNWPLILAFLAGVTVAAWAFTFGAAYN